MVERGVSPYPDNQKIIQRKKIAQRASKIFQTAAAREFHLSPREIEVLCWRVAGLNSDEIGKKLSIAKRTAEVHASNLYRKIGVKSAAEAISWGISRELIGSQTVVGGTFRWRCRLSERELDVFRGWIHGFSNQEIAKQLAINENTVGVHKMHIYQKAGTSGITTGKAKIFIEFMAFVSARKRLKNAVAS